MFQSPFIDKEKIHENKFAFAIYDGFPVSKGHEPEIFLGAKKMIKKKYL